MLRFIQPSTTLPVVALIGKNTQTLHPLPHLLQSLAHLILVCRHVRVFDLSTRSQIKKIFLKQRQHRVIFTSDTKFVEGDEGGEKHTEAHERDVKGEREDVDESDDDAMWDSINKTKKAKTKRKNQQEEEE
eukprot:m.185975 g.185975  ORF g.185975 m.185975 type:complete len:131 (+) comp13610_c0_seq4:893-1285(+)